MKKNALLSFREAIDNFYENRAHEPKVAEISFEMYDELLTVDYGTENEIKRISTLFGIKIIIDPMLRPDEIVFRSALAELAIKVKKNE